MWWQDRLPALLSLSFVLGLLSVPGLIIVSVYLLCSAQPQNTPLPLLFLFLFFFAVPLRGGQAALKLCLSNIYSSTLWKERVCWTGVFLFIQLYRCALRDCSVWLQPSSVCYQLWSEIKSLTLAATGGVNSTEPMRELAHSASSNMAAGLSLALH